MSRFMQDLNQNMHNTLVTYRRLERSEVTDGAIPPWAPAPAMLRELSRKLLATVEATRALAEAAGIRLRDPAAAYPVAHPPAPTQYFITSDYFDYSIGCTSREDISSDGPFAALLANCMTVCAAPKHVAATYLATGAWFASVVRVTPAGGKILTEEEMGYPWDMQLIVEQEIAAVTTAIARVDDEQLLLALPGMEEQSRELNLAPARAHLASLIAREQQLRDAWAAMCTGPTEDITADKEHRVIQLDPQEE